MNQRVGVSLIGGVAMGSRIHERLDHARFRVRAFGGSRSMLRNSRYIEEFVSVGSGRDATPTDFVGAIEDGTISPDDWVIWGTDEALHHLAQSSLPVTTKLSILPTTVDSGLQLLGSKAGFAALCNDLTITTPRSKIARSAAELSLVLSQWSGPFMLKGNTGFGGHQVRRYGDPRGVKGDDIPQSWFPVVVQDFVEGPLVSVEALFRRGELVAWLYSVAKGLASEWGVSTVRHFQRPLNEDFREPLKTLGQKAGLHGFANCSFVWNTAEQRHLLFELDMRPNRWHQFGPDLGVSWAEAMVGPAPTLLPPFSGHHEAVVHLYPREIEKAIRRRSFSPLMPWIRRDPGTWQWRQGFDKEVNRQELRFVLKALVHSVVTFPIRTIFFRKTRGLAQDRLTI